MPSPSSVGWRSVPHMVSAFALDHIVLVVADVERSLAWYTSHAGLASVNVDEWRAGQAFFPSLRVDASTIIDFVEGEPTERGHLDHLCFVVSEADLVTTGRTRRSRWWTRGSGRRAWNRSVRLRARSGRTPGRVPLLSG